MYICEDVDKTTLGKAIDFLQASIDDDFMCQARNRMIGGQYLSDVPPTMPGFSTGTNSLANFQVHVPANFFKR
jgi:hypothetical protein